MIRKFLLAGFVLAIGMSIAAADEFRASITKVSGDGKTLTVLKFPKRAEGEKREKGVKGERPKGEEVTLTAADSVKVETAGKFDKETKKPGAGTAVEGGLSNELFQKIGERGIGARITTGADGKVTEVTIFPQRKGGGARGEGKGKAKTV